MDESPVLRPEVYTSPYPQFLLDQVFDPETANHLLDWLSSAVKWELHRGAFFEQYECNLLAADIPDNCRSVFSSEALAVLRTQVGEFLGTNLVDAVTILAHKLVPGQGIGIHNDNPRDGLETHRLVVQLNRGFEDSYGGHLLVLGSSNANEIVRIVRPIHNTGFGFAMSERSFHAVSELRQGERYTIVFSFWDDRYQPLAAAADNLDPSEHLRQKLQFLIDAGAGETRHSNENLLNHLANTYALLQSWDCPAELCDAGLFHSIYGTGAFQLHTLALSQRSLVVEQISAEAEQIVYQFCILERGSLYQNLSRQPPFFITSLLNNKSILINESQLSDLLTLDLANSIEQLPRLQPDPELIEEERQVYRRARRYLPEQAWQAYLSAYAETGA